ncbi:MAG: glycine cleavage system protein H, partial [Thermoprotei archaeon]
SRNPALLNSDPYSQGWMFKIKPDFLQTEKEKLLSSEEYTKLTGG